ncbi:MAG TPA: proline--tRNA ligase [Candidatus Altiarchaeales archaeon]|nr:proline--tRNA ligase [Candidatus Altiarchaeales archaeon]HEX55203.1 proline--tRNA ligase [Candidatus Altiarchaeales archaeon]
MIDKSELSEWYHRILKDAKIVDSRYPVKGMLVYRRWGLFIIRKIQRELEKMLEESGHEPMLFPVAIPENVLKKETRHIAGFEDEVFWITHAGRNELDVKLALRPTSETPIYEMFKLWIRSHRDLPFKMHQSCAVYRYETKHTRPLIRGREFLWNEGHSAHESEESAKKNILEIKEIYGKLINEVLCLPFIINERPEWDRFPGADNTYAIDTIMPDGRTLQIATIHNLGQNFSRVFDIKFETEKGTHEFVYQTSYGPSFGRLLASVICIHGDDNGLILPPRIAPLQVIIIPILFKESENEKIIEYSKEIEVKLREMGIRTEIDMSEDHPGAKFYHWEMMGVPVRIEIGPREVESKTMKIVRRDTKEKFHINIDEIDRIGDIFNEISRNLRERAEREFKKRIFEAKNIDEIRRFIGRGIIETGWCGKRKCIEEIEEIGDVLSINNKEAMCVVCRERGREIRIAKSY